MTTRDDLGLNLTGANATSREAYGRSLRQFQCYIGDPVAAINDAIAESPGFTMAHVFKAYMHLLGTEPAGFAVARECLAAASALKADARETAHIAAASALVNNRWHAASRILEDIAIAEPLDALALQAGHGIDFFTGHARMLRDRIARALPAWDKSMPGYHALLGMHAFGLEETGDYAQAERQGRAGVALEPRDGWSWHAVAHALEMQGRYQDGIAWLESGREIWPRESFFAVHNWWHLAVYHLEAGDLHAALSLFDGPINGTRSTVILEMIDASAMLWRLHLRGVELGTRWNALADNWSAVADSGNYAFNDAHAMMAFVGAGRRDDQARVLAAQDRAMARDDDNAAFTRDVGRPVALAIQAFGVGHWNEALDRLRGVRSIAARFGGSHAQRDLIDLTMVEAALRSGRRDMARALAAERVALKPASPLARLLARRATGTKAAA